MNMADLKARPLERMTTSELRAQYSANKLKLYANVSVSILKIGAGGSNRNQLNNSAYSKGYHKYLAIEKAIEKIIAKRIRQGKR